MPRVTAYLTLPAAADLYGYRSDSTLRTAAREGKLRTKVGVLEGPAKDPDEFLRAAGDRATARWEQVLKAAQPGWEFWIRDSIRGLNPSLRPADLEVALRRVGGHEAVDAIERVGGDAPAIAQPRGKLAVVDRAPPEGRFREPALAAVIRDFLKEFLGVHDAAPAVSSPRGRVRRGFFARKRTNPAPDSQPQIRPLA